MKKLLALLLLFGMLLSFACSEDLPYARSLSEKDFINTTLLTEETAPQVCLTPNYPFYYLEYPDKDPAFLCFSWPQGSQPSSFDSHSAYAIDNANSISYHYYLDDSAAFETFLNKAESEDDIVRDGTDGTAAYVQVHPTLDDCYGYGMIKTAEFGKSAKLEIRVRMYEVDEELSMEERKLLISDAIAREIDRVRSEMNVQIIRPYVNAGKFRGFKMLDYDSRVLTVFDLFPMEARFTRPEDTGLIVSNQFVLTKFDGTKIEGSYLFGNGNNIDVEIELNTYGNTTSRYDTNDKDTGVVRLDNGNEWYYRLPNRNDDGSIYAWRAEKKLNGFAPKYSDAYYIEFYFSGTHGVRWENPEVCENILRELDSHLRFVSPSEDKYIAPEKPDEPAINGPTVPSADDGTWVCPNCRTENHGKYCSECGSAKPEDNSWTCGSCGTKNEGKFCTECGSPKP